VVNVDAAFPWTIRLSDVGKYYAKTNRLPFFWNKVLLIPDRKKDFGRRVL
jgi:hypothetical protein